MRAFIAVADHGGISAAAAALGYAQSSVSDQIKGFERDLGVMVLNRTSTGAVLTEAGLRLLPQARQLLELDDEMRRSVARLRPALRVGALETLAGRWLPEVLAAFAQGADGTDDAAEVTLSVGSRRRLADDLAAGRLDVVFVYGREGDRHPGPRAVVARDHAVLVAAADHPLARSRPVTADGLRQTQLLVTEGGCTSELLRARCGRDLSSNGRVSLVDGSSAAVLRLTALGRGVALLPHLAAVGALASGALVRLEVPGGPAAVGIEARWRSGLGPAQRPLHALLRLARRHQPTRPGPVPAARAQGATVRRRAG